MLDHVVHEFHEARLGSGVSQGRIGHAIDRSDAWISWTESGANASLSIVDASRMLACVGLDLSVRAYPAGRGIRDEAQLALIARLKSLVMPRWEWRTEVPIPLPGDLRAWDVVLRGPAVTIGVEAESRLRDIQALGRRVMLKLRDSGLDRVVIVGAATRTNRTSLRALGDSLRSNYPDSITSSARSARERARSGWQRDHPPARADRGGCTCGAKVGPTAPGRGHVARYSSSLVGIRDDPGSSPVDRSRSIGMPGRFGQAWSRFPAPSVGNSRAMFRRPAGLE